MGKQQVFRANLALACRYLTRLSPVLAFFFPQAFTFFATHFLELTTMDSIYPNVEKYAKSFMIMFF